MKKYDVIALGELLIDFTSNGKSNQGNPLFEANPGGAPCNVLAMLQKLGKRTAFVGKVGKDVFGELLIQAVKEQGIATDYLTQDPKVPTTLAFVHTKADGDRSFSFYRNPGADMMLTEADLEQVPFAETKIFHFGTLSMTDDAIAHVTKRAVAKAKEAGAILSFDPNYRPLLWENADKAKEAMWFGIQNCDLLKISDDEIEFLTGQKDIEEGLKQIQNQSKAQLLCGTMGKAGSKVLYHGAFVEGKPFIQEGTIETTGAGDTFMACVIHFVLEHGMEGLTTEELGQMLTYGNAAASIITTRKGALRVMPSIEEIEYLLSNK